MKVIKNGFGKRKFQIFKLNEKSYCINIFGIALFIGK